MQMSISKKRQTAAFIYILSLKLQYTFYSTFRIYIYLLLCIFERNLSFKRGGFDEKCETCLTSVFTQNFENNFAADRMTIKELSWQAFPPGWNCQKR